MMNESEKGLNLMLIHDLIMFVGILNATIARCQMGTMDESEMKCTIAKLTRSMQKSIGFEPLDKVNLN